MELNININDLTESKEEKQLKQQSQGAIKDASKGLGTDKMNTLKYAAAMNLGMQGIKRAANRVYSTELNKISSRYGDQARYNEINNVMSSVSEAMGMVGTIVTGFMVGGPVGAGIAAAFEFGTKAYEVYNNNQDYKYAQIETNISSQRSMEALGLKTTDLNR